MSDPLIISETAYDASDEYRPEPEPALLPPAWQDGSFRIGIHTSIAGDIAGSLDIASKLGANAVQIFSASPRMWPRGGMRIADADAARFRARRAELALGPLVIHDNYLINLGSPDRVMRVRSIQAFHDELIRAVALGADFLVAHPGSGLGANKVQAISDIADGMRQAVRGMKLGGVRILLENTAGMGSSVGARFEELRAILDETRDLPMGVCLDTAHMLEAGYDITTAQGLRQTLDAADRAFGLKNVYVLHVNDSKTPLGSRVDRHENIGAGKIGLEAFRRILNDPRLSPTATGVPGRAFILETPIDEPGDDRRNVRALWDLVGIDAKQAPKVTDGFSMVRKSVGKTAGKKASPVKNKAAKAKTAAPKPKKRAAKK